MIENLVRASAVTSPIQSIFVSELAWYATSDAFSYKTLSGTYKSAYTPDIHSGNIFPHLGNLNTVKTQNNAPATASAIVVSVMPQLTRRAGAPGVPKLDGKDARAHPGRMRGAAILF